MCVCGCCFYCRRRTFDRSALVWFMVSAVGIDIGGIKRHALARTAINTDAYVTHIVDAPISSPYHHPRSSSHPAIGVIFFVWLTKRRSLVRSLLHTLVTDATPIYRYQLRYIVSDGDCCRLSTVDCRAPSSPFQSQTCYLHLPKTTSHPRNLFFLRLFNHFTGHYASLFSVTQVLFQIYISY